MTIAELIAKLQQHPPEADVCVIISHGAGKPGTVGEPFDTREFHEGVILNCRQPTND